MSQPVDIAIAAGIRETVTALRDAVRGMATPERLKAISEPRLAAAREAAAKEDRKRLDDAKENWNASPMSWERVSAELEEVLEEDAIVVPELDYRTPYSWLDFSPGKQAADRPDHGLRARLGPRGRARREDGAAGPRGGLHDRRRRAAVRPDRGAVAGIALRHPGADPRDEQSQLRQRAQPHRGHVAAVEEPGHARPVEGYQRLPRPSERGFRRARKELRDRGGDLRQARGAAQGAAARQEGDGGRAPVPDRRDHHAARPEPAAHGADVVSADLDRGRADAEGYRRARQWNTRAFGKIGPAGVRGRTRLHELRHDERSGRRRRRSSTVRSSSASTSSIPRTSMATAARPRSTWARRSGRAVARSSSPRSSPARCPRSTPGCRAARDAGSCRPWRAACAGSAPTTSISTRCTAPTRPCPSRRRCGRSTISCARARCATSAAPITRPGRSRTRRGPPASIT